MRSLSLVWLLALIALVACSSEDAAPTSSANTVRSLAAQDDELRAIFEEAARPWAPSERGWESAGWEAPVVAGRRELAAKIPERATGSVVVRVGRSPEQELRWTATGAAPSTVQLDAGVAVYPDAWTDADLVVTQAPLRFELLVLLRTPRAPTRYAWELTLGSAFSGVEPQSDGSLLLAGASGAPLLRIPPAFAIDANGVRRDARVEYAEGRLEVALDTSGLDHPILLDPAGVLAIWQERFPPFKPGGRNRVAMAYDELRGKSLLFGGLRFDGVTTFYYDQTYEWDGTTWSLLTPAVSPPGRYSSALVYMGSQQRGLLFGGFYPVIGYADDTWEWDSLTGSWLQKVPSTKPPGRREHAMSYDSARDRVVLFGGLAAGNRGDTWEWDGTNWQNRTPLAPASSPSPRTMSAMAYDAARGKTILFGGMFVIDGLNATLHGDTWEWDGTAWTLLSPATSPNARSGHTMTYDSTRARVILQGGWGYYNSVANGGGMRADTWEWDGTDWVQTLNSGGPDGCCNGLAYDPVRKRAVGWFGRSDGWYMDRTFEYWVQGIPCTTSGECGTGNCVDSTCCAQASCGSCQSCGTLDNPGVCAPVVSAEDPDTCTGAMICSAVGVCKEQNGQPCLSAAECASGHCVDGFCCNTACGASCDACATAITGLPDGTCAPATAGYAGSPACGAFVCNGTATTCGSSCTSDALCESGYYCAANGTCQLRKAQATSCNAGAGADCLVAGCRVCATGNCVDGFCCNTACGARCDACNVVPGTCSPVAAGSPGSPPCAPYVCTGASPTCGTTCSGNAQCVAGAYCDGTGACVPDQANGADCTSASQCASGFCVDGFCCDGACSGPCDACARSITGGADGTCAPAPAGSPGSPACSPFLCNGSSVACSGSCSSDAQCAAGAYCASDGTCRPQKSQAASCNAGAGADCLVAGCRVCTTGQCVDGHCCDTACGSRCDACDIVPGVCSPSPVGAPGTPSCAPYLCTGSSATCGTTCASDAECAATAYCNGAGACAPDQANGATCTAASQCASGFCVDGFCCDTACGAPCQACAALLKASGANGVCGFTEAGKDPRDHCVADAPASCQNDGQCDGAGGCRKYQLGSACGATTCVGNLATGQVCNGFGACTNQPSGVDCAPYVCATGACAIPCSGDGECVAGNFCDSGTCRAKAAVGAACGADTECASGSCVDGFCCDTPCQGLCQACAASAKASGADDGICGAAAVGMDPHDDCPDDGAPSCDRNGACDGAGQCSIYATGTACGVTTCLGNVQTGFACDGAGACVADQTTDCGEYRCNGGACNATCTSGDDCASAAWCDAGSCVATLDDGTLCDSGEQCATGLCVDGVCCNAPCAGQCEACNVVGAEGICVPVSGAPVGPRAGCDAATGSDPCTERTCDGTTRTSCAGYVGASVSCRAASCADGLATAAASCDGKGGCPTAATEVCAPYACGVTACGRGPCDDDSDCANRFKCAVPTGATDKDCVPASELRCDGDHTVTSSEGDVVDCSPYRCDVAGCLDRCQASSQCIASFVCDGDTCVEAERAGTSSGSGDDGGCGCRSSRRRPEHAWAISLLLLLAIRRRRGATAVRAGVHEARSS